MNMTLSTPHGLWASREPPRPALRRDAGAGVANADQHRLRLCFLAASAHLPYTLPMAGRASSKRAPVRPRSERLEARISSEQKALFQRAAELQGRTLTDFVIASVHESAVKAIAELEAIRLTAADSRAFAEALLHPREPVPELRAAAERYSKMVGRGSDRDREPAVSDRST